MSPPKAPALVTGASGYLGRALLSATDRPIVAVLRGGAERRAASLANRTGAVVSGVDGDIAHPVLGLDEAAIEQLRGRVGVVVHAAGHVEWSAPWPELMHLNATAAGHAVDLAAALDVPMIHISTLYAARRPDASVPERLADEVADLDKYERSKCRGEWTVADRSRECNVRSLILRVGALVGDLEPTDKLDRSTPRMARLIDDELHGWIAVHPRARLDVTPRDVVAREIWRWSDDIPDGHGTVRHISYGDRAPLARSILAEAQHRNVFRHDLRLVPAPGRLLMTASRTADRFVKHSRGSALIGARYFADSATYECERALVPPSPTALAETLSSRPRVTATPTPDFYRSWV